MQATAKSTPSFVLYDDQCSFCVAQMRLLKRLDRRDTFEAVPLSNPRAGELVPGLSQNELLEAMRCVTRDGRIYAGASAFRHLALRIPLLVPLALLLWVPGMIHLAEWIYRRIARNRYVLSRILGCESGACVINHPGELRDKKKTGAASVRP